MDADYKPKTRAMTSVKPTCYRCGRTWPDPASRLCGYCRSESGLPGINDKVSAADRMPEPALRPTVYRVGT